MKKKMLVIEDDETWQNIIMDHFGEEFEIIQAYSEPEAILQFSEHPDVAIILMDGSVDGSVCFGKTTVELTEELRPKFTGIMVGISGNDRTNRFLLLAGCDCVISKKNFELRKIIDAYISEGKL